MRYQIKIVLVTLLLSSIIVETETQDIFSHTVYLKQHLKDM